MGGVFVFEAGVDIADQVVIVIIADNNLLDLAIFAHFAPDILVKSIKVVLDLHRVHLVLRVVCWVLVKVGQ